MQQRRAVTALRENWLYPLGPTAVTILGGAISRSSRNSRMKNAERRGLLVSEPPVGLSRGFLGEHP